MCLEYCLNSVYRICVLVYLEFVMIVCLEFVIMCVEFIIIVIIVCLKVVITVCRIHHNNVEWNGMEKGFNVHIQSKLL